MTRLAGVVALLVSSGLILGYALDLDWTYAALWGCLAGLAAEWLWQTRRG